MEGSIIAGRYVINGIIGSGGMAIVYRGYDRQTGDLVAIKVLRSEYMQDESYVKRFEKESQIAVKYSHKNIVRTIEVGCQEGRHYIVMELVDGMTLKEYIAKYGRLKPAEVVRIGWQICDALFYAHSHQLIHRDIKPQNILISKDGTVKVADFGIAKMPDTMTVTMSGSNVLGSVHYISPEQARGGLIDEKADIYSIGIVFYEMVTGVVPFTGDSPVAVAIKHLQEMPRPPRELVPDIPKAMEMVILKAISKEQSARYDNAREMGRDLERTLLEPEGSYIKIKQTDDYEGTKPIHVLRNDIAGQAQQTMGSTGPRRTAQTRPERPEPRRYRRGPRASSVLLAIGVAFGLLAVLYLGARAIISGNTPKTVKVIDVTGLNIDVAKNRLDSVSLKYDITEQASDTVEKDTVMEQDPQEGKELPPGGTVLLKVSSGLQQVDVPDVSTLSYAEAKAKIEQVGLVVGDVRYEQSDKEKDSVVRQEPAANESVDIHSNINIWLARPEEKETLLMPNVFGSSKEEAAAELANMGIIVSKIIPKNSSYPLDIVIGQSPEPGTPIDQSVTVQIWVSNNQSPGYQKNYDIQYDVATEGTNVKIVYIDGDTKTTVYAKQDTAGSHDLTILLDSAALGEKTLVVYFDGVEFKRETVIFSAEDAS